MTHESLLSFLSISVPPLHIDFVYPCTRSIMIYESSTTRYDGTFMFILFILLLLHLASQECRRTGGHLLLQLAEFLLSVAGQQDYSSDHISLAEDRTDHLVFIILILCIHDRNICLLPR